MIICMIIHNFLIFTTILVYQFLCLEQNQVKFISTFYNRYFHMNKWKTNKNKIIKYLTIVDFLLFYDSPFFSFIVVSFLNCPTTLPLKCFVIEISNYSVHHFYIKTINKTHSQNFCFEFIHMKINFISKILLFLQSKMLIILKWKYNKKIIIINFQMKIKIYHYYIEDVALYLLSYIFF